MGFRTSIYKQSKEYLDSIKDAPFDDKTSYLVDALDNDATCIMYDCFTDSVLTIYDKSEYASKIYNNLPDDYEGLYVRMNKKQFANFIKYVLSNYVNHLRKHKLRHEELNNLEDELKSGYNPKNRRRADSFEKLHTIDKLISNQHDFNMTTEYFAADLTYFDEILNNPWHISKSWGTREAIHNLIHIYHMMNWDIDEILIIGG